MLKNSHLLSHDELEWMINSHLLCKNRPINPIYPFHSILLLLHNTFVDLLWVIHAYHPTYVLRSLVLPLFFISIINISRCMMMGGIVDGKQIFNGSWQAKMTGLIMYLIALKMFLHTLAWWPWHMQTRLRYELYIHIGNIYLMMEMAYDALNNASFCRN